MSSHKIFNGSLHDTSTTMTAYQSISHAVVDHHLNVDEEHAQNHKHPPAVFKRSNHRIGFTVIGFFVVLALASSSLRAFSRKKGNKDVADPDDDSFPSTAAKLHSRHMNVPMPSGVNLGSWVR